MRELGARPVRLTLITEDLQPDIHVHHLSNADELEKRIPLASAQTTHCAELEELQELLHFPEEVALRLADTEYQLFYQVPPIDYLRQVTLDLGGSTAGGAPTPASAASAEAQTQTIAPNATTATAAATASATGNRSSSVATLIKRFNEVSAWVTQLIISQPTHDARRAVLSCVLRVALSSWNIGNFNGAMEIIAGLKSNKLKPFWLSITEKESLPVLDFLSAALLSAEYDRALSRALAMAECPVVPFFGAFLRELREILSAGAAQGAPPPGAPHEVPLGGGGPQDVGAQLPPKPKSGPAGSHRDQMHHRQVFISDYDGEDHHFTKIGPGGLINLEKIYRTQAVMDHISLCHQHYHTRNRLSPTSSLIDYLKCSTANEQRVLAAAPPEKAELDSEYDCDVDDYHPVQPLIHDHGVSFVCLSSPHTKVDQHVMQILHHGSTVVLWEGAEGGTTTAGATRGVLLYLRLDRSSTTLTWVRPSWSGLKAGSSGDGGSDPFSADFNLSFNPEDTLAPGLLTKLALQAAGDQSTGSTLDDGFLDLLAVKEVHLGGRDAEREAEVAAVARRYGLNHEPGNECALTILYGYTLSDNRLLYVVCPPAECRVWYSGLCWLIKGLARQQALCDRRLLWLREQYMQLYHEDGYCCGPLAADAIRSFGGRDWSLAGMANQGGQVGEPSGALRREVSMKIKKKQLLSNQTFKDRSLRSQFVEPSTMCMESSYWRNPTHHRQSTPTTFPEHQPDVARHHSLGQLAYNCSQPKFDRDRHGSTEHLWHGRHPRVGSILYDTQLDFVDFVTLFRSFSLLIRKDLRDLFEQLAISYRSMAVNTGTSSSKINGVKTKVDQSKKAQKLGLLTRNSRAELEGSVVNSQKKIFDAIAAASIFTNCAGIDTNNSQVITISTFTKFLETRQMEKWTEDQVKSLIYRHEPDATLRSQNCLSFEGFARYLMDKDNYAFTPECEIPNETDMNRPMSTYYVASSHNTYLTGHQLKGESSVELYSQVLLTGCRCVELDCWDGDDGYPMIYHGHTFTTKIPFNAVVETIERNAFVTSPYPVILSIENHCSLQQQTRMAHIFQRIFGEKLVTSFLFEADFSDEPSLPSPEQLKNRILIKNKKLIMEVPAPLTFAAAMSTPVRPGSGMRHSVPGRTSSIISNTSSSSFNDDFSDDEYDDEDDEDNIDEKAMHGIGIGMMSSNESPRPYGVPHAVSKTSSTKRITPDDKLKKKSSQISKELSDMVVYVQAIKFRGLNTISPSSSVKQRQKTCMSSSGSSIVTTGSSSASNISSSGVATSESDAVIYEAEMKQSRPNVHPPCYQCSSINENTAKKLCRKQPLALIAHTQTQLMRTYPAGMRIDSSNFNPVIFWSFGIQMAALNYQTDDSPMQLNSALFEMNGRCGFVRKPSVMWDRSHVMYRRFNPWDKEFDGIHSSQIVINIVSGQYVSQSNVNLSTYVEVEIIGIQIDCNKQKTKVVQKNALNPIWNDTFHFRVMFQDLAFLRFTVMDATNNHLLAQRIVPLKCLRPGYRHLRLRSAQNKTLNMSTLFIYSRVEEESLDNSESRDGIIDRAQPENETTDSGTENTFVGISGTPLCVKRRMFFLMVYGVVSEEPYTILKITQESTTQDVLLLCLQKANLPVSKVNDYILVEEVARGWEKKDTNLPATQRILDLHERPLQAQSQWKGEGRFILKRMGDDPSSRAWLSSIRSVANREREQRKSDGAPSNAWEENDTFLVCIYNVSPEIPYAILKVPLNACAQDVLAQALVKARRLEDPLKFVIVEELEWGGTSHNIQQRPLADSENVYSAQSHWQTIGRFVLQERVNATPTSLRKNRIASSLRLATLDRISRGLNVARSVATNSIKVPVQVALSDPTTSKWKSKTGEDSTRNKPMSRAKMNSEKDTNATSVVKKSEVHREVHSEGETLSDEETKESDLMATVSRLKKVSLRKFKEWKS
ncbi:1-phosphatidylinositol 4,5-bisphosphate phosphodiesterase epsilon-1-like isoform X2 [Aethina tumida]|uniref:1-phosphatidylinositol 4,5-bisphosphate phosphodiesterase epsilon-1-like isoform X2 n=1 Tax=Aethina tumida TaxID=116153 RepID=UPI0021489E9F|nr:1-phosphatidylinositol 4,5-bisphosphate phosphodiesterase epsilon-1-like isoform X2 [Aethina tumida]